MQHLLFIFILIFSSRLNLKANGEFWHRIATSSENVASSDEYTLHRIKLGVPEGVDDIPTQDSFPMDANMDMMGGGEYVR